METIPHTVPHPVPQPVHESRDAYPSFDLGLTPSNDCIADSSSNCIISPEIPVTQPSVCPADRFVQVYEPRRSKRVKKTTRCGTDGHKCVKRH